MLLQKISFCDSNSPPYWCLYSLSHLQYMQLQDVSNFVQSVNTVLKTQEETERVEAVMARIVGYNAVEIPSELREVRTHS